MSTKRDQQLAPGYLLQTSSEIHFKKQNC